MPVGMVGVSDGPTMAADSDFTVTVTGSGGHAALPHQARDPVVAAAQVISALQCIVSRNVSPIETGVLSVTIVRAGSAFNVIPDSAVLSGTIRSFKPEVRELLSRRLAETARSAAQALGCTAEVEVVDRTPPVINDSVVAAGVRELAVALVGAENVRPEITMGSEDMAYMMQTIPGCYFFIGAANADRGLDYPHHHARFDFDESALALGSALMASAAGRYVFP
jgi:amidohydrolase